MGRRYTTYNFPTDYAALMAFLARRARISTSGSFRSVTLEERQLCSRTWVQAPTGLRGDIVLSVSGYAFYRATPEGAISFTAPNISCDNEHRVQRRLGRLLRDYGVHCWHGARWSGSGYTFSWTRPLPPLGASAPAWDGAALDARLEHPEHPWRYRGDDANGVRQDRISAPWPTYLYSRARTVSGSTTWATIPAYPPLAAITTRGLNPVLAERVGRIAAVLYSPLLRDEESSRTLRASLTLDALATRHYRAQLLEQVGSRIGTTTIRDIVTPLLDHARAYAAHLALYERLVLLTTFAQLLDDGRAFLALAQTPLSVSLFDDPRLPAALGALTKSASPAGLAPLLRVLEGVDLVAEQLDLPSAFQSDDFCAALLAHVSPDVAQETGQTPGVRHGWLGDLTTLRAPILTPPTGADPLTHARAPRVPDPLEYPDERGGHPLRVAPPLDAETLAAGLRLDDFDAFQTWLATLGPLVPQPDPRA